jgi:hypothetical protein
MARRFVELPRALVADEEVDDTCARKRLAGDLSKLPAPCGHVSVSDTVPQP